MVVAGRLSTSEPERGTLTHKGPGSIIWQHEVLAVRISIPDARCARPDLCHVSS